MTVCIAAASSNLKQIVTVSDMRVETQTASMDNALLKFRVSPLGWHCLFSASDISRFESIWARINAFLFALDPAKQQATVANVEEAVEKAYRDERRHMAEVTVLGHWTMDLPTFESDGRAKFGDDLFTKMHAEISALKIDVELLLFGFNFGLPHIMQVGSEGVIEKNRPAGPQFGAIGSGKYIALDSLYSHADLQRSDDSGYIIYRLCEAKFAAETTPGVGPDTTVAVFAPAPLGNGVPGLTDMLASPTILNDHDLKKARALWQHRKNAEIPERILSGLRGGLSVASMSELALLGAYVDAAKAYSAAMDDIVKLRADGFVGDDQWETCKEAGQQIREAAAIFRSNTKVSSLTKTLTPIIAFQHLMVAIANIEQIRRNASHGRNGSGDSPHLITSE